MAISKSDFEQLSQLLDGELDPGARERLEQRISAEPELGETWRQLMTVNSRLQSAYAGGDTAGVPTEIRALLKAQRSSPGNARKIVPLFGQPRQLWPMALAASLVLAVAIALLPDDDATSSRQSRMTLADALESTASGDTWHALADGGFAQAVLTFPNHNGGWCREFLLRKSDGATPLRGVACRASGNWHTEVLAQGPGPESSDVYRPASASDNNSVQAYIRDHAADIPLNGNQENALIERSWR